MKTIDWNIGMVTGVLKGIRFSLTPDLLPKQVEAIEDAIKSIEDIERWTLEAKVVMNSWDNVRKAVEDHPDSTMNDGIAHNALRFIKRDTDHQRRTT